MYDKLRRAWEDYLDPERAAAKQQHVNGKTEQQQSQAEPIAGVNGLAERVQP